jgi:hypothetical protein
MLRVLEAFEKRFESLEQKLNERFGNIESSCEKIHQEAANSSIQQQSSTERQYNCLEERLGYLQTSINKISVEIMHPSSKLSQTGQPSAGSTLLGENEDAQQPHRALLESFISWGQTTRLHNDQESAPADDAVTHLILSPHVPAVLQCSSDVPHHTAEPQHRPTRLPPANLPANGGARSPLARRRRGRRASTEAIGSLPPERGGAVGSAGDAEGVSYGNSCEVGTASNAPPGSDSLSSVACGGGSDRNGVRANALTLHMERTTAAAEVHAPSF